MPIKLQEIEALLKIKDEEIQHLQVDQLRLLLGVFRYLTRILEREINRRKI